MIRASVVLSYNSTAAAPAAAALFTFTMKLHVPREITAIAPVRLPGFNKFALHPSDEESNDVISMSGRGPMLAVKTGAVEGTKPMPTRFAGTGAGAVTENPSLKECELLLAPAVRTAGDSPGELILKSPGVIPVHSDDPTAMGPQFPADTTISTPAFAAVFNAKL